MQPNRTKPQPLPASLIDKGFDGRGVHFGPPLILTTAGRTRIVRGGAPPITAQSATPSATLTETVRSPEGRIIPGRRSDVSGPPAGLTSSHVGPRSPGNVMVDVKPPRTPAGSAMPPTRVLPRRPHQQPPQQPQQHVASGGTLVHDEVRAPGEPGGPLVTSEVHAPGEDPNEGKV